MPADGPADDGADITAGLYVETLATGAVTLAQADGSDPSLSGDGTVLAYDAETSSPARRSMSRTSPRAATRSSRPHPGWPPTRTASTPASPLRGRRSPFSATPITLCRVWVQPRTARTALCRDAGRRRGRGDHRRLGRGGRHLRQWPDRRRHALRRRQRGRLRQRGHQPAGGGRPHTRQSRRLHQPNLCAGAGRRCRERPRRGPGRSGHRQCRRHGRQCDERRRRTLRRWPLRRLHKRGHQPRAEQYRRRRHAADGDRAGLCQGSSDRCGLARLADGGWGGG